MHKDTSIQFNKLNYQFEVLIVRTARELYDYIYIEEKSDSIQKVQPLLYALLNAANDYYNSTGGLHPDLGLELREWATLKQASIAKSSLTTPQADYDHNYIDSYGQSVQNIIEYLEHSLGLDKNKNNPESLSIDYPESHWDPIGSLPPYVGVIADTDHIASFRTGGPTGDHTLIADGDFSSNNVGFNGDSNAPGYNHYGSKY